MKHTCLLLVFLLTLSFDSIVHSEVNLLEKLDEVNAQIEKTPDDPGLYYEKTMCLFLLSRRNEGYETAKQAMEAYIKNKENLIWMSLEYIELANGHIHVRFNMRPNERNPPDTGIIRPLSFHIFNKDMTKVVEMIDYEVGLIDGQPRSAAFRKSGGKTYLNLDSMDKLTTYEDIRQMLLDLVKTIGYDAEVVKSQK